MSWSYEELKMWLFFFCCKYVCILVTKSFFFLVIATSFSFLSYLYKVSYCFTWYIIFLYSLDVINFIITSPNSRFGKQNNWRRGVYKFSIMALKLRSLRRLFTLIKPHSSHPCTSYSSKIHQKNPLLLRARYYCSKTPYLHHPFASCRSFCSPTLDINSESHGPAAIDYRFVLQHFLFFKLILSDWVL